MGLSPSPFTLTLGRRGSVIFFPLLSTRIALDDHVIEERRHLTGVEEVTEGSLSNSKQKPWSRWWDSWQDVLCEVGMTGASAFSTNYGVKSQADLCTCLTRKWLFTQLTREKGPFPVHDCSAPNSKGTPAPFLVLGLLEMMSLSLSKGWDTNQPIYSFI